MTEVISPCSERFSTTVRTKKGPTAVTETAQDFSLLFVDDEVDFLETIEELGMRGAELFKEAGGEELRVLPCLNSAPEWVEALAEMLEPHLGDAGVTTSPPA